MGSGISEIQPWSIQKSKNLYGIDNWGADYFSANELGHIVISPDGPNGPKVDLFELVQMVQDRDIELPILFRFNGILRHRVRTIYQAFDSAIREQNYTGKYFPAYPVKVNQQRHIVDVLCQVGNEVNLGLEVGSKPELIAVLALHDNPNALLLCNGYKDEEYIELALVSKKVGRRPIIIVEKASELAIVLKVSQRIGVTPEVGFRLKLAGKGSGRWERSGGDRAKFGLTTTEVLACMHELEKHNQLSALSLLHFHIGSQLTSIAFLREALREMTQVYVQLRRKCENLNFIDIGGGLGVDYDGSKTTFASSMNYTVEEYARDVVWIIDEICQQGKVPHPNIVSESGRALVAHHSVLVFNTLGIASTFSRPCNPQEILAKTKQSTVQNLSQLLIDLTPKNCQESLHDAVALRNDLLQQFNLGLVTIEDRAMGDEVYWALLNSISRVSAQLNYVPEDLERLAGILTDTYFCNFSVFQSLPDNWAIQQIFPITPIHRLNEEPSIPVVLADITCDSDGSIDRFPDLKDVKRYLNVHPLRSGEPYYFAAFLIGAYQEILGDLHNLFGDTNAVHVEVDASGNAEFTSVVNGDNIREVLKYVQYDKDNLCERWRSAIEGAVSRGQLSGTESGDLFKKYQRAFDSYTYLVSSGPE